MTNPVLNLGSKLVDKDGYLIAPWSSFFQQFTQKAPKADTVTVGASPFSYQANASGTVAQVGGTITALALIRGTLNIPLPLNLTLIPIRIGDIVKTTYSVKPAMYFLGD